MTEETLWVATKGVVVEDSVARVIVGGAMYYLGKGWHSSRSIGRRGVVLAIWERGR